MSQTDSSMLTSIKEEKKWLRQERKKKKRPQGFKDYSGIPLLALFEDRATRMNMTLQEFILKEVLDKPLNEIAQKRFGYSSYERLINAFKQKGLIVEDIQAVLGRFPHIIFFSSIDDTMQWRRIAIKAKSYKMAIFLGRKMFVL